MRKFHFDGTATQPFVAAQIVVRNFGYIGDGFLDDFFCPGWPYPGRACPARRSRAGGARQGDSSELNTLF